MTSIDTLFQHPLTDLKFRIINAILNKCSALFIFFIRSRNIDEDRRCFYRL